MPRCRKFAYNLEHAALATLRKMQARGRSANRRFHERAAYQCSTCHRWHLTS